MGRAAGLGRGDQGADGAITRRWRPASAERSAYRRTGYSWERKFRIWMMRRWPKPVKRRRYLPSCRRRKRARVVECLRNNGHSVAYMGDGINDAPAMKAADVGISVDSAVDIRQGIGGGGAAGKGSDGAGKGNPRRAENVCQHDKIHQNDGVVPISEICFLCWRPARSCRFCPWRLFPLILLNMIYDISCTAVPWTMWIRNF